MNARTLPSDTVKVFTVSELTNRIKRELETGFGEVAVRGEISNLKIQSSGHIYFTVKDKESQIAAVLFRGAAGLLPRPPKDGDLIVAGGQITVYPPRGSYQLLVKELKYLGAGELLAILHERKNRLQALGYFAKERKKKLPPFPKKIGVITSPTGAVIQDILQILERRCSGFHLVLYPVKVQGEGAAEEIALAIRECNAKKVADVLIVGRGGGSLEDLWAFNEEGVAKAIFDSDIPVISAVGHETDYSICDFAADLRAPTPSAAAELVTLEKKQYLQRTAMAEARIGTHVRSLLSRLKSRIGALRKHPFLSSPHLIVSSKIQRLDEKKRQLTLLMQAYIEQKKLRLLSFERQIRALQPSRKIANLKQKVDTLGKAIETSLQQTLRFKKRIFNREIVQKNLDGLFFFALRTKRDRLTTLQSHLASIDPKNLLTKGYCILFSENKDSVILSSKQLAVSQSVHILLQDGTVTTKVEDIQYGSI